MSLPVNNDTKERLSLAFARVIAARCGCYINVTEGGDLASIDGTLESAQQPKRIISIQLKSTSASIPKDGGIPLYLKIKNYDDLRRTDCTVPQILVLVALHKSPVHWLKTDANKLTLKRTAWWTDLWGAPASSNSTVEPVIFDRTRLFNTDGLMQILDAADKIRAGTPRKPLYEL